MATVVHDVDLLVAAEVLDWPVAEEVKAIFERYP